MLPCRGHVLSETWLLKALFEVSMLPCLEHVFSEIFLLKALFEVSMLLRRGAIWHHPDEIWFGCCDGASKHCITAPHLDRITSMT